MHELFHDGGWTFAAILACSLLAWAIATWKWLQLRAEQAGGLRWMDDAADRLAAGRREEARRLCEHTGGLAARLMREAMHVADPNRRAFETRLAPRITAERVRLRGQLALVAVVAGLCPLLGLLGTVLGMMTTFAGVTAGGVVRPDALARGVSQALVTTQAGLVMALPLLLVHGYLRSRMDRFLDAVALHLRKIETIVCRD